MNVIRNSESMIDTNLVMPGAAFHADLDYDRELPAKPIGFTADFSTHPALQEDANGKT